MSELPNNIRDLRKSLKMTLKTLSERSGRSVSYIQKLEMGERGLRPHELTQIAEVLGVPPADLLSFEDGALTIKERAMIDTYRNFPVHMQTAVDHLINYSGQFGANPEGSQTPDTPAAANGDECDDQYTQASGSGI